MQAMGVMEADAGDAAAARSRFRAAAKADPDMPHTYTAWAAFEAAHGSEQAARDVFEEGVRADPSHVPLLHVS